MKATLTDGRYVRLRFFYVNPFGEDSGITLSRDTQAVLEIDGQEFMGVVYLAPGDQFCKARGRKIALRRALNYAKVDRSTRSEIWRSYLETHATA